MWVIRRVPWKEGSALEALDLLRDTATHKEDLTMSRAMAPVNNAPARMAITATIVFTLCLLTPTDTFAAPTDAVDNRDAEVYASFYGVTILAAATELRLQAAAGDLETALRASESDTFAGLWIEHTPNFQVVAAFTVGADETLTRHLPEVPELASVARATTVTYSLAELAAASERISGASGLPPFDLRIVEKVNAVEITVESDASRDAILASLGNLVLSPARFRTVASLAKSTANIYGGLDIGSCTSGFSVLRNGTSTTGVLTAAHCFGTMSYQGTVLPFQWQNFGGPNDEQWHTTPGFTDENWVYNNAYTIAITSKKTWSQQTIGMFVCHMGQTTKYGCGEIVNKSLRPNYVPNATATYIQVSAFGMDLSSEGDSGGPWWINNTALGIMSGCVQSITCNDAIYVATNYVEGGLGVTILTS